MGWLFSLLIIGGLVAFNVFAADMMMRMRTDVQIIRKALADNSVSEPKAPKVKPEKPEKQAQGIKEAIAAIRRSVP